MPGVKATPRMVQAGTRATSQAPVAADEASKILYKAMDAEERRLGGGEGMLGVYGTIRKTGMQKVVDALKSSTGMGRGSRFLDVGAGLGRPMLHALISPGVARSRGFEIEGLKVAKGQALIQRGYNHAGVKRFLKGPLPTLQQADIEHVNSIDDTHIFSFWEGLPNSAKTALGKLVTHDQSLRGIAVIGRGMHQDPVQAMIDYSFPKMQLKDHFPVQMAVSGQQFTAYVFRR